MTRMKRNCRCESVKIGRKIEKIKITGGRRRGGREEAIEVRAREEGAEGRRKKIEKGSRGKEMKIGRKLGKVK